METRPAGAPDNPDAAARWRRGPHPLRLVFLAAMLPVVFALIAAVGLIGQEITAPSWLKSRIEAQAEAALQGGTLRFGAIRLTIPADLHPVVRLTEVTFTDAAGAPLARVPEIRASLSPRALILRREVQPQEIALQGAELRLRRGLDGTVAVALGGGSAAAEEQAQGLGALLDRFDAVFQAPALAALRRVTVGGLVLNYEDARAGRAWTVDGGTAALDIDGDSLRLSAEMAVLSRRAFVTTLSLTYERPRGSRAASLSLDVADAAAADIASQSPALAWLSVLDAPISASIRSGLDSAGALDRLSADLAIGAGALAPAPGARPVAFAAARARLDYDPAAARIDFAEIAVDSDWGEVTAEGRAYLREVADGRPGALIGQFRLAPAEVVIAGVLPGPLHLPQTDIDLRLRLDPFRLTIGQIAVAADAAAGQGALTGQAEIVAGADGWTVAADARLHEIGVQRLLDYWPPSFVPPTRAWLSENLPEGRMTGVTAGLRLMPGAPPHVAFTAGFEATTIRAVKEAPPITGGSGHVAFDGRQFSARLSGGIVTPAEGGAISLAGSEFLIPDTSIFEPPSVFLMQAEGSVTAALSLLDGPPFRFLSGANLPVSLAIGQGRAEGRFDFPLAEVMPPDQPAFDLTARLSGVESAVAMPGHVLTADSLDLAASRADLTIAGDLRIGAVPASGTFRQEFRPGSPPAEVEGRLELSQRLVDEFAIALPPGTVAGAGSAEVRLTLPQGAAPDLSLTSDLRGVRLQLPALGWTKAEGSGGTLDIEVRLGTAPRIDRFAIEAAGLSAAGEVALTAQGALGRARFDRVRLGGWLDAPVTLIGRGPTAVPEVVIEGGSFDLREASFGPESGEGGPMRIALDRLLVTEGIELTDFRGEFDATGGLTGSFAALVNGDAPVSGAVVPQAGRSAVRLQSERAGDVLRAAGYLENAVGGTLDLTLVPAGAEGTYDGRLEIGNLRVRDAPALASLLNAISVVGLLQQMGGQGLVFDEVEADFRVAPDRITVLRSSAVGPGLGISLDGVYTAADRNMDFQGVISPLYIINAVGAILTRRGEGLIGFSFRLRGPFGDTRVTVNPLSVLTPGMFREIFRRPPPEVGE